MVINRKELLEIFDSIDFEKITEHPNILIAANFWDEERYKAAKVCYKYLRAVDDMIDCHKAQHQAIQPVEQESFSQRVSEWLGHMAATALNGTGHNELLETIRRFHIPLWPMEDFARSMIYDIYNDGFPTLESFIEYSQGASVAPASIFVHLNGLTISDGNYLPPAFDVKNAATPCALFSYIVHIIRDFEKDQHANLDYFAGDLLKKHGLERGHLRDFAFGTPVNQGFRNLIAEYCRLADRYKQATYEAIQRIGPLLGPRYRLSLHIIFNLYLMVFEKIDPAKGSFTTAELNPSPGETRQRVLDTILAFDEGSHTQRFFRHTAKC